MKARVVIPFKGTKKSVHGISNLNNKKRYHLLPHLVTLMSLYAGMNAIRFAILGSWKASVICVMCGVVLDMADGRLARFLGVSSPFGMQLDSLVDLVSFGVAPAMILYLRFTHVYGWIGWAACMFFVGNAVIRLARFNVMQNNSSFLGFPSPYAASLSLSPIMIYDLIGLDGQITFISVFVMLNTIISGLIMNIPITTPAFKKLEINQILIVPVMLLSSAWMCLLFSIPWITLVFMNYGYLLTMLIYSWRKGNIVSYEGSI